jgi:Ca2+-binding EF-hand superfamily protein
MLQRLFQSSSQTGQTSPSDGQKSSSESGSCAPSKQGGGLADQLMAMLTELQKGPPPPDQLADKLISSLDTDGDGAVSGDEIKSALTQAGADTQNIDKIVATLDKDGDGKLGKDELTAALAQRPHHHHGGAGMAALGALDTNQDGALSQDEITAALGADAPNTDDLTGKIAQFDTDGDGALSFKEILDALQAGVAAYARQQGAAAAETPAIQI